MIEKFNNSEVLRTEEQVNEIINTSISEVVDTFKDSMTPRDAEMLSSVIQEKGTNPVARVQYLLQIKSSVGVSESITEYVNHVLQTLRQELTPAEQKKFAGWNKSMLDDM